VEGVVMIIDNATGEIIQNKDRAYYASTINGLVSGMVEAIIETGRLLIEAKDRLDHGEFIPMIEEDLPFERTTAFRFMSIAENRILANVAHGQHLPPSWRTLYELTKLPAPALREKIESGEINPNTTRKEARAMHTTAHVSRATGENEWYTPAVFTDAARRVMGEIDLDPASSDIANESVKAKKYFTIADDGLAKDWGGRVWMNPPYSQPLIAHFCGKLLDDLEYGNIEQAITLTNNATETKWLNRMIDKCTVICFPIGRVRFIDKEGNPSGAPLQGQIILYFGFNTDRFIREFTKFGPVR